MTFSVYANDEIIGTTQLESGDPPMGVAFGAMIPSQAYSKYKSLFISKNYAATEKLELFVVSETGERLEPCSGVGIVDYSEEMGETMIEVNIMGLDLNLYQKYFSDHIETYRKGSFSQLNRKQQ